MFLTVETLDEDGATTYRGTFRVNAARLLLAIDTRADRTQRVGAFSPGQSVATLSRGLYSEAVNERRDSRLYELALDLTAALYLFEPSHAASTVESFCLQDVAFTIFSDGGLQYDRSPTADVVRMHVI
jgi:hypothetical protein